MPDATKRPLSEWRETEWLQHLQRQAQRLTACPYSADDLAHTCLTAFYDHHRRYPWQHPEPAHALRWCCQKLRALACDAHRYAERHPCLALETLPESVACVDIAAQVCRGTSTASGSWRAYRRACAPRWSCALRATRGSRRRSS